MKIQIKDYISRKVLFELDEENNSTKKTLMEAIKQGVNLRGANLCGEDLRGADLCRADLRDVNLYGADLCGADLCHVNLCGVNLCGVNLCGVNLCGVNLCYADLRGADLCRADLCGANLCYADLRGANLCYADLRGADLYRAELRNANLYCADLHDANNVPFIPFACPSEGSFIGWKKIKHYKEDYKGIYIVKLEILENAKRCSATTEKCRCDKAKVLEITNISNGSTIDIITNTNEVECVYKVGEMVYPDSYDEDRWNECSHGIHFFINKEQAINY